LAQFDIVQVIRTKYDMVYENNMIFSTMIFIGICCFDFVPVFSQSDTIPNNEVYKTASEINPEIIDTFIINIKDFTLYSSISYN
jgi:hypothetical protein